MFLDTIHPIAGTEESGPSAGFKDLFKIGGQLFVEDKNPKKEKIEKLKKKLGIF